AHSDMAFWILTSLADAPQHGYAILQRIRSGAGTAPKTTTLYATLDRLEARGLIEIYREEVVDGRARRTYGLTGRGRADLEDRLAELERAAAAARQALGASGAGGTRPAPALRAGLGARPMLRAGLGAGPMLRA